MEIIIWHIGIALPVAALLFLLGWLVGFNECCDDCNWGIGFDDGWDAYKELVIERGGLTMGLISKEAALAAIDHEREMLIEQRLIGSEHVVVQHARRLIEDMQTVPAVPLDKLCEWMSENNMNIPCKSCTNFSNGFCTAIGDTSRPCPKTADDWRQTITNWMEAQDAAD